MPGSIPQLPNFINTGEFKKDYEDPFQAIRKELEELLKAHKAGEAIYDVITKLEPAVQQYKLDYVQGNIANDQTAASYALQTVNYVSAQYKAMETATPKEALKLVSNALEALDNYGNEEALDEKYFGGKGGMGDQVYNQLETALGLHGVPANGQDEKQVKQLVKYWRESWQMTTSDDLPALLNENKAFQKDPSYANFLRVTDELLRMYKPGSAGYQEIRKMQINAVNLNHYGNFKKVAKADQEKVDQLVKDQEVSPGGPGKRGPGISMNAPIMQAFTAAQNQAQSMAAYLQSEEKIANEDYQKFAAADHDTASDFINVEKATTQAMQSSNN